MQTISDVAKLEKNKLNSDSIFLIALDIDIPDVPEIIHIVNNNEDITWNATTYIAFPFSIDEMSESTSGEVSEFTIKVSNVNNVIGNYLRQYDAYVKNNGFEPISVTISVINTNNLDSATPEIQHKTVLIKPTLTRDTVTFTIGGVNAYNKTINTRMFRNACRWKFKSVQCGYDGVETTCNKTFARCKELANQSRFGGFPTIGNKGVLL